MSCCWNVCAVSRLAHNAPCAAACVDAGLVPLLRACCAGGSGMPLPAGAPDPAVVFERMADSLGGVTALEARAAQEAAARPFAAQATAAALASSATPDQIAGLEQLRAFCSSIAKVRLLLLLHCQGEAPSAPPLPR